MRRKRTADKGDERPFSGKPRKKLFSAILLVPVPQDQVLAFQKRLITEIILSPMDFS
jgi:hypothetical protein